MKSRDKRDIKKIKFVRTLVMSLSVIVLIGSGIAYTVYNQASNYLVQEAIGSQVKTGLIQAAGVDLSESGRILSKEEMEKVETLLGATKKIGNTLSKTQDEPKTQDTHEKQQMTTDEAKEKIEEQVTKVIEQIPAKDKNAMVNLALSNLSTSDISYLGSLAIDGISSSDMAEAKRIALKNFSTEEIEQLRNYYDAYSYLIP